MADKTDGWAIARERIAQEASDKTGFLDLGSLGLTRLPEELFRLTRLRRLNLGAGMRDDNEQWQESSADLSANRIEALLSSLAELPELEALSVNGIDLASLGPLAGLTHLVQLDCSETQISDLAPLAELSALQTLNCSRTQVGDLGPLAKLSALQSLHCWNTQISDLAPLAELSALQSLDCSQTQVGDLGPLAKLSALQSLDCSDTQISDLAPLAELSALQTLNCSRTQVGDLGPLAKLSALQELDCSETQVGDLGPLARLSSLQTLHCSRTQVGDLGPLAELSALQTLFCWGTQVGDLGPLAKLSALQSLFCSQTQVGDLGPLAKLSALQSLFCSRTQVGDLGPLAKLSALQSLFCSGTQVDDLGPLAQLSALQELDCSETQVGDLGPLAQLSALQTLNCSQTQVGDLGPLAQLSALQSLFCSQTQVGDLAPLAKLSALQSLFCSGTQVDGLGPLAQLSALQELDCSHCRLTSVPDGFWDKPSLRRVSLYEAHLPGVPGEVLSQSPGDDCLESLRAHLRDLMEGAAVVPDVKLVVLGNGRVGKTQICRRLRKEDYDDAVASTHGIVVTSAELRASDGAEAARLHIWDFGGQDVYHGTHALFIRTRAIFLLVWTPERERSGEQVHDGVVFRDYPLAYWFEYVTHLGGLGSPLLLIQTRCDLPQDEAVRPPLPDEALAGFPFRKIVHYSAKLDRGRATLDDALSQAVAWLTEQEGVVTIGAGRLRVKRRIEALRDADAALPDEQRRYRTISQKHFRGLCNEEGGISSAEYLLEYLHNAGTVFYRRGLIDDRIILDQSWALEAVYAVFHRQKCYKQLRQLGGRFTRPLLEALVWDGYSVEEQKLFLSMMESCGICFLHRRRSDDDEEDTYIAPDLLPERDEVQAEIDARWQLDQPVETAEFEYALLHPGIVRSVISRIGSQAGMTALYWRGGLCVYEQTTGSRALIEQQTGDSWSGRIRVRTQSGQPGVLLDRLKTLIEEEGERTGSKPVNVTATSPPRRITVARDADAAVAEADGLGQPTPMQFAQERPAQREYCISYAWGDATPEGTERERIVDQLCDAAEQRRITVIRDKNVLGLGESISKFMQRIGRADRVFVVLSDKYLRSPYCMFELFEVWRNCRREEAEFVQRVRAYTLPGTNISRPRDRLQYAIHWKEESETLAASVKQHGPEILGEEDLRQFKLMQEFSGRVSDILALVSDRLQPHGFDQLEKHWLDDLQE